MFKKIIITALFVVVPFSAFAATTPMSLLQSLQQQLISLTNLLKNSPQVGQVAAALPTTVGWSQMSNTTLDSVCAATHGFPGVAANSGCSAITWAWNSGVMDTTRNRILLWGGGHNDYWGNEVYALSLESGTMQRITDPATPNNASCPEALAGGTQPNSRHTYDGIEYMPNVDKMFVLGGSLAPCGYMANDTWFFNMQTNAWEVVNATGDIPNAVPGLLSGYDANTGKVFVHDNHYLYAFNPTTKVYTMLSDYAYTDYHLSAVVDPVRKKFVMIGNGDAWVYDISASSTYVRSALTTTGGAAIVNESSPGLVYDPVADKIVAWAGGNTVYSLDMNTKVWTPTTYTGGPGAAYNEGTFGRWQYSPQSNAFVYYGDTDANAYIFRMSTDGGTTTPPTPVSGSCGSAHGQSFTVAPSANLCSAGVASGVTTGTNTYTWSCVGTNGGTTAQCSAGITPPQAPTLILSILPTAITAGESSTLTWSSTNTTSCTATGGWTGAKAVSGTQVVSPVVNTTYTLACTGTGGTATQSASVVVSPASTKFSVNDRIQTTAVVNVRGTASPTGTLLGTQAIGMQGVVTGGPTANGGYNWWNINFDSGVDGWSAEDYLVRATTSAPAPTLSFSAAPQNITAGQSSTLTWSSTNTTGCTATGGWTGTKAVSGTQVVSPTATTSYALSCIGAGGSTTQSVVIGVAFVQGTTTSSSSPVASYNFNEGTGTTLLDRSGARNGTFVGTPTWSTTGKNAGGIILDGTDTINFGSTLPLQGIQKLTISAWVKRASLNAPVLIGRQNTSSGHTVAIELWTDGKVYFGLSGSNAYAGGSVTLNDTNWHHVTMVYDGTKTGNANRIKGYVDGVAKKLSFQGTVPTKTTTGTNAFGIGSLGGSYSNGQVDDVRVYTRPLSAAEVVTDMNTAVAGGIAQVPSVLSDTVLVSAQKATTQLSTPLTKGVQSSEVATLQQFLIKKGLLHEVTTTTYFGTLTEGALKRFQCENLSVCSGTPDTTGYGVVGPRTRAAINSMMSAR